MRLNEQKTVADNFSKKLTYPTVLLILIILIFPGVAKQNILGVTLTKDSLGTNISSISDAKLPAFLKSLSLLLKSNTLSIKNKILLYNALS